MPSRPTYLPASEGERATSIRPAASALNRASARHSLPSASVVVARSRIPSRGARPDKEIDTGWSIRTSPGETVSVTPLVAPAPAAAHAPANASVPSRKTPRRPTQTAIAM
jgi:hypothetical protein